ncbi:uncharacterized protein LOC132261834 [Phlebotomus argentipes]|uniref:uncharacterized protein LOC132261834 n=1 Tax=Phlebotomus argentipes TaxID=94469 RepID=UPI0028930A1E|nr:uncharacterized protein LOC132261834 [Phlebotomus argentipes]
MDSAEGIARVSSDGEAHEILTIVAISSGVLVAVVILIALRVNLRASRKVTHSEKRRFSLFSVRRSVDISAKPEIYTIDARDAKITIENDKYLYIPGITTLSI